MNELEIPGLDGSSLLGFLAGLGLLRALAVTASEPEAAPRLGWNPTGSWHPLVTGAHDLSGVAARVIADAHSDSVADVLSFAYVKREKRGMKSVRSLVPPVAVLRAALASRVAAGAATTADYFACLMCENAVEEIPEAKRASGDDLDRSGVRWDRRAALELAVGPTPFDFTSRNTQFLDQIRRIRDEVSETTITQELAGGVGAASDRIMRWDALVDTPGALFDRVRPMTHPVAEWLAFRGISFFPIVAENGRARIAGLAGRRKAGDFSWSLWSRPLPVDVIATQLGVEWASTPRLERMARGIGASFTVRLGKDATGYDGVVSQSRPLVSRLT